MEISEIGYSILTAVVVLLVLRTYYKGLINVEGLRQKAKKNTLILFLVFIGWMIYLKLIGDSGLLWNFDIPPRFPLFIFIPLLLITIFILVRNKKSELFTAIPKENVIYFQSFRIFVEIMILYTYLEGVFPVETTFEGYNYEIIIGALAPIIAFAVYKKKWLSEKWAMLFNITGLLTLSIIIFIVITSLYVPGVWGEEAPRIGEDFTKVPYLLLPGFLAPMAIFAHVFSIIQIRKSIRN